MVREKKRRKPIYSKDDAEDMDSDIEDVDMDAITDSEEEYTESERKLLEKARNKDTIENYDSEDEVYGLQYSEKEEEEDDHEDSLKSDIEELQEDDMPDDMDWGSKAHVYYSSDYKYSNYGYTTIPQKDVINANTEQGEGERIRTKLFGYIDRNADNFANIEDSEDYQEDKEKVFTEERNEYFFMNLINSFKEKMAEVKDILIPFLKLAENETWSNCDAVNFVKIRYRVLLNYCINISFCLMMEANGLPVESHPIMKRLAQYRQLFEQLQGQENLLEQIADVVKVVKKDKSLHVMISSSNDSQIKINKKAARLTSLNKKHQKEAAAEDEELSSDNMDEVSIHKEAAIDENVDIEEKFDEKLMEMEMKDDILNLNEEAKRAITYQMAKNRGLTPYRKKELRNPRVKHRNKYRKAKIRRKGAVREVRKLQTLYQGELSGINAGVKKGIKIK